MSEQPPRLVLRRTNNSINDKVVIRLSPEVDRSDDLYGLFQEGILVEVIDIEESREGEHLFVTLGFRAPQEFKIDRVEKMIYPRTALDIGMEQFVNCPILSSEEAEDLSEGEVHELLTCAEEAIALMEGQIRRLRRDRSKAADKGYARPNSERHDEWLMIAEELTVLEEQIDLGRVSRRQLDTILKRKRFDAHNTGNEHFKTHFVRLAKERLDPDVLAEIEGEARALANKAKPAA